MPTGLYSRRTAGMSRSGYRTAYESLKAALEEATASRHAESLDRAHAELDAFVASIATDERKLRSVAADSPRCATEIRAHADAIGLPRRVLDPVHDASFTRLWLASLPDNQITMLRRVLADEVQRRDVTGPARLSAGRPFALSL
ncbi:hypothetical protein AAFN86_04300 [Roseomonas sp. CAU 1739]|uniref:hypothetical protein n=1 Tax=Roseomonas sp. CAU 1739 TaxID=3140364 RepID=UPI00325A7C47